MRSLIPGPWFIAWKSEPEKVPYLGTDKKANVWTDGPYLEHGAAAALAASDGFAGVGVVFSASHRLGGVDIDAGRDPATGNATPWAAAIIAGLGGGAVPSPSGTGWRVWVLTDKDPRGPRKRKWTGRVMPSCARACTSTARRAAPGAAARSVSMHCRRKSSASHASCAGAAPIGCAKPRP